MTGELIDPSGDKTMSEAEKNAYLGVLSMRLFPLSEKYEQACIRAGKAVAEGDPESRDYWKKEATRCEEELNDLQQEFTSVQRTGKSLGKLPNFTTPDSE